MMNSHVSLTSEFNQRGAFALVLLIGILLRLLATRQGYNFDVESYRIVADLMAAGENVYKGTNRYNYGPIWFNILAALDAIPCLGPNELNALRWKVAIFLTGVDIAIATLLYKRFKPLTAFLFFLNPVSIIITGYHSQFDNLAILLGFLAILRLENQGQEHAAAPKTVTGILLIALSLATKHILFLLPLWLAIKQPSWRKKLLFALPPYTLFALSFAPYFREGAQGILDNVLLYRSFNNAPFWKGIMPAALFSQLPHFLLFLATMIIIGLLCRMRSLMESFLLYLLSLVIFSSAIANQYLAICILAISVLPNIPYLIYSIGASLYLSTEGLFPAMPQSLSTLLASVFGYPRLILLLALGLLWQLLKPDQRSQIAQVVKQAAQRTGQEVRHQIKAPW